MESKEVIVASALAILFYWCSQVIAEAVESTGTKEAGIPEISTTPPGYVDDTSHIFIRYPGLNIFTPLLSETSKTTTQEQTIEQYLDTVRKTQQSTGYYASDLNALGTVYIAAPKLTVDNITRISAIGPIRILATELSNNAKITIPKILSINRLPAEMYSFDYVPGKGGLGNSYYAVYKVVIKYPKIMPEVLSAIEQILTQDYAYSYDELKSTYGDI